ncbi:MAG TPA: phosphatase PAP2 family protein [Polyangia bacterium]|jgi:membrane-associated phospholipid phosphatase
MSHRLLGIVSNRRVLRLGVAAAVAPLVLAWPGAGAAAEGVGVAAPVASTAPAPAAPSRPPPAPGPRAHLLLDTSLTVVAGGTALGLELGLSSLARPSCPCAAAGVNGFDRAAIDWNFHAGIPLSDVAVGLAIAGALAGAWFAADTRDAAVGDALLVLESTALAALLTEVVKIGVSRPYPYMYRSDVAPDKITNGSNYASFWSGHTATPMAAAVSFAAILQRRQPRSAWRWVAWVVGPALAIAAGLLQMSDANHFPSDVLTGAGVGAFVGYGNIWLHER